MRMEIRNASKGTSRPNSRKQPKTTNWPAIQQENTEHGGVLQLDYGSDVRKGNKRN